MAPRGHLKKRVPDVDGIMVDATRPGSTWMLKGSQLMTTELHKAIRKAVDQWRCTSLNCFALDVSIIPLKDRYYAAFKFRFDGVCDMNLRVKRDYPDCILLHISGRWTPLEEFLASLYVPEVQGSAESRFELQSEWWKSNGKHFPLTDLAAEIRNNIYMYATRTSSVIQPGVKAFPHICADLAPHNVNTKLLRTSKTIHAECKGFMLHSTVFRFEVYAVLTRFSDNPYSPFLHIKVLDLAFSHDHFLKYFGCGLDARKTPSGTIAVREADTDARIIRKLDLRQLTLWMPSTTSGYLPWWSARACNTMLVDWILKAAWRCVKGQPVRVMGNVVQKQKEAFETKAQRAWEERQAWRRLRSDLSLELGDGDDGWDDEEGGVGLGKELTTKANLAYDDVTTCWTDGTTFRAFSCQHSEEFPCEPVVMQPIILRSWL